MRLIPLLIASCVAVALAACSVKPASEADNAQLKQQLQALQQQVDALKANQEPVELGQQMLELQTRHARLWAAGQAENWLLAHFMLAELDETLGAVVAKNGDHAALQPARLAEVLPSMMDPAIKNMRIAIDAGDKAAFEKAYDGLSEACTRCHQAAGNDFLVMQRPRTPVLDNLDAAPVH